MSSRVDCALEIYYFSYIGSDSTLNISGAFSSRKLQRQAMKAGKKLGLNVSTSRSRAIRRTRSAQVCTYIVIQYKGCLQSSASLQVEDLPCGGGVSKVCSIQYSLWIGMLLCSQIVLRKLYRTFSCVHNREVQLYL